MLIKVYIFSPESKLESCCNSKSWCRCVFHLSFVWYWMCVCHSGQHDFSEAFEEAELSSTAANSNRLHTSYLYGSLFVLDWQATNFATALRSWSSSWICFTWPLRSKLLISKQPGDQWLEVLSKGLDNEDKAPCPMALYCRAVVCKMVWSAWGLFSAGERYLTQNVTAKHVWQ